MAKKKKEEKEIEKIMCDTCQTLNDIDANYCKKCGLPINISFKKTKLYDFFSTVFKILSLTMITDVIWLTRPLMGTSRWDNIMIEYGFMLFITLLLSTFFRMLKDGHTLPDFIKKETYYEPKTRSELGIISYVIIFTILLFIYTNTRIIFLKPGNNYVEKKVGEHITRWYKVRYERTGVRKCDEMVTIGGKISIRKPFCYDYTYLVKFRDGDTCYIHYTSEYNHKVNKELFSYCSKK